MRAAASLLVAVVLLLTALPGEAAVLCVAPDGHFALEAERSHCCLESVAAPPQAPANFSAIGSQDPCDGCTDYQLTGTADIVKASPTNRLGTVPLSTTCALEHGLNSGLQAAAMSAQNAGPAHFIPVPVLFRC